jgi:hypothetical protein
MSEEQMQSCVSIVANLFLSCIDESSYDDKILPNRSGVEQSRNCLEIKWRNPQPQS